MESEFILEAVHAAIEKRNNRIASKLSLIHNSPDDRGRNRFEQEQDRLERVRLSWQNTESPIKLGEEVLIPAGTPVGLVPMGAYVTEKPIRGVLDRTHSLRGGSGHMEHGHRTRNALALITIALPPEQGQTHTETIGFLVANDMFKVAPQEPMDNSSNTPIT